MSQVAALQARLDELERRNAEIAALLEAAREENAGLIRERDRLRALIDRRDFELRQSRDALSIERDARIALEARLQAMEALSGRSDESAAEGLAICLTENERLRARVDRVQYNFDAYFRTSTETLRRLLKRNEACAVR